jgi:hypothetical protein
MPCRDCERLLGRYRELVRMYNDAVAHLSGAIGNDFKSGYEMAARLRTACESANEDFLNHWSEFHGSWHPAN